MSDINIFSISDSCISNGSNWNIIDSTLTNGHKNILCNFSLQQKKDFILLLDKFGIEYVELENPNLSNDLYKELESLIEFKKINNLSIKFIINIRDITSDINKILLLNTNQSLDCLKIHLDNNLDLKQTIQNLSLINPNIHIHLAINNAFQLHPDIISNIIAETETYINTICLEDTLGISTHYDVETLLTIIDIYSTSIECIFQNDSSSAVYNSYIALLNGCKYINTSVLGLGKKNGITDLSGFISRIYTISRSSLNKYNLHFLKNIDTFVSKILNIYVPINNPITGFSMYNKNTDLTIYDQNTDCVKTYQTLLNPIDFILHNNIFNLKQFLDTNNINLDDEYVKKLSYILQDNINKNPRLYYKLYVNQNYALKYILQYIS
jgi:isopropylmalate/homocitrate/citramalate synthase